MSQDEPQGGGSSETEWTDELLYEGIPAPNLSEADLSELDPQLLNWARNPGAGDGGELGMAPTINQSQDVDAMADQIEMLLQLRNEDEIFVSSGELVVVGRDNKADPIIQRMHDSVFTRWVSRAAIWVNREGNPVVPLKSAVGAVYHDAARLHERCGVPVLEQIASMPFFTADGTLVTEPGYSALSRTWLEQTGGVHVPQVPLSPTARQVKGALSLLVDDLLVDFPFANDASRSHALALLLLPFMRDLVDGPTPLHVIDAPVAGSGKGKLTKMCLLPALGRLPSVTSFPRNDDRMEKKITAMLMAGRRVVVFDNANEKRGSELLAAATTEPFWTERVLGESRVIDVPIRSVWVLNGNNVELTGELVRRAAPWVRLDPGRLDISPEVAAQPHLRTGFKHAHLEAWANENLGKLAWAALVLIQSWLVAGRKDWTGKPVGSYESWSLSVGGVLEHVGVDGFLGNRAEIDAVANEERDLDEEAVATWWLHHRDGVVTAGDLIALDLDYWLGVEGKTGRGATTVAGHKLRSMRDRTVLGVTVTRNDAARGWQLVPRLDIGVAGEPEVTRYAERLRAAGLTPGQWARGLQR